MLTIASLGLHQFCQFHSKDSLRLHSLFTHTHGASLCYIINMERKGLQLILIPSNPNQFFILNIMTSFFKLIQIIKQYDLGSVIKSIVFPFVFVYVTYHYLIELLSESNFNLPEFVIPTPTNHPLFQINEQLQSVTVKNLRKMQSFPKSYRKQDMINALLITC